MDGTLSFGGDGHRASSVREDNVLVFAVADQPGPLIPSSAAG